MKIVHFVLLVFWVSFISAYTASYAADRAIINTMAPPGKITTTDYNGLSYHNRGASWQEPQPPDVRKIQTRLKELGYNCGQIDGVFGPKTEQAIRTFQKDQKLVVDGIAGPVTCKALNFKK